MKPKYIVLSLVLTSLTSIFIGIILPIDNKLITDFNNTLFLYTQTGNDEQYLISDTAIQSITFYTDKNNNTEYNVIILNNKEGSSESSRGNITYTLNKGNHLQEIYDVNEYIYIQFESGVLEGYTAMLIPSYSKKTQILLIINDNQTLLFRTGAVSIE